jgi:hypothetical protein
MRRAASLYSLMFVCLTAGPASLGQSNARPEAGKVCPFSIVGLWRSNVTAQTKSIFFDFSPEGYVTLLGYSPGTLPQDFEMVESVNYKLDKPAAPRRIEFTTPRGNDAFPQGVTPMDIIAYSDDSFTTLDPASGQKTQWTREQTRRYFLTFAARGGTPQQGGPVLAMWTTLDGREPKVEALGVRLTKDAAGKTAPEFGPVPAEIYDQIRAESEKDKKDNKDGNLIMRFELTTAEFEKTHAVFETWDKYVTNHTLPEADPYLNGAEFLRLVAEGLNQCGEKVKLYRPTQGERDEIASKYNPSRHPLEYVRVMRKKNDELHVNDAAFPWSWRPAVQSPGQ